MRITRDFKEPFTIQPAAFSDPVERDLFQALETAEAARGIAHERLCARLLTAGAGGHAFFEAVLVMAEDSTVRSNRLGLLQRVAALASGAADLSALEGF